MLIRYEANIKDCSECFKYCEFYFSPYHPSSYCPFDNVHPKYDKKLAVYKLPCQLRPCPIEVK